MPIIYFDLRSFTHLYTVDWDFSLVKYFGG